MGAVGMVGKVEKKPGKKLRSPGGVALGLLLMGIFIGELLFYTWCRVQYTRVGYEISSASAERARQVKLQKELQLELARLKSPERLAGIAESSMGLKRPTSRQMVVVE